MTIGRQADFEADRSAAAPEVDPDTIRRLVVYRG